MTGGHQRVRVIDSHTGGEPTRVVVSGGPDLGRGPLPDRLELFRREHDTFRSAVVNEPRGSDVMVGALLCEPTDPTCATGVIFFNNVGYLGMCGHGTIGLVATLAYMNRIQPGEHRIETPVGTVSAVLHPDGKVTVNNVASYRLASNVAVDVPHYGKIYGDVAWGGNWFFLVRDHKIELCLQNIEATNQLHLGHPSGAAAAGNHRRRQSGDRSHRALRNFRQTVCRQQEFCSLSRQSLRPLSLRHRYQRQAGLPLCGRKDSRGPDLEAGKYCRQHFRGQRHGSRRQGLPQYYRLRLRECRSRPGARRPGPLLSGHPRVALKLPGALHIAYIVIIVAGFPKDELARPHSALR